MTEDDTFRRLKRHDFKDLLASWREVKHRGAVKYNLNTRESWAMFNSDSGWTFDEFIAEYQRRLNLGQL